MHYRIINFVITLVITYCVVSIKAGNGMLLNVVPIFLFYAGLFLL